MKLCQRRNPKLDTHTHLSLTGCKFSFTIASLITLQHHQRCMACPPHLHARVVHDHLLVLDVRVPLAHLAAAPANPQEMPTGINTASFTIYQETEPENIEAASLCLTRRAAQSPNFWGAGLHCKGGLVRRYETRDELNTACSRGGLLHLGTSFITPCQGWATRGHHTSILRYQVNGSRSPKQPLGAKSQFFLSGLSGHQHHEALQAPPPAPCLIEPTYKPCTARPST